jgi:hypothetical protein
VDRRLIEATHLYPVDMPLETWPLPDLPMPNDEAEIWRYFRFNRFEDLIQSSELYFCRSDLFDDKHEGLPTDEYIERICRSKPQLNFKLSEGGPRTGKGVTLRFLLVQL